MFWFDIEGQVQYVGTETQGTLLFFEWNHDDAHGHVSIIVICERKASVCVWT
jgi:hypothetical protein